MLTQHQIQGTTTIIYVSTSKFPQIEIISIYLESLYEINHQPLSSFIFT